MELREQIERLLNVKITEVVEEIRGKTFPLFDLTETQGLKIALIKDPVFIEIDGEDVRENKIEGNYIIVEKDDGYIVMKYEGEPNVEALRSKASEAEEAEHEEVEAGESEEEVANEDGEEQKKEEEEAGDGEERSKDVVKEILNRMPKWADGVVITEKDGIIVLPVKKSVKKEGTFYASLAWKQLDIRGDLEGLLNRMIIRNGKVVAVKVYITDKYVNVYTFRPRSGGKYSRRR
jgi:hypothetical protein